MTWSNDDNESDVNKWYEIWLSGQYIIPLLASDIALDMHEKKVKH